MSSRRSAASRQSTESAMGNDILMGLIELFTNSDDQYGDQRGSILVEFPKPDRTSEVAGQRVRSGDRDSLRRGRGEALQFGGRTSGYERGESKRGNRGRGAKDLSAFGHVRWDIIKDGKYFWLWLDRSGEGEMSERPEPAGPHRESSGSRAMASSRRSRPTAADAGVRIAPDQQRLEYAVQLRGIMSNPKRSGETPYSDEPARQPPLHRAPRAQGVPPVDVEVEGYPGLVPCRRGPTPFQEDQSDPCRHGGSSLESGRAVHEATLYRFESGPYAGYFMGRSAGRPSTSYRAIRRSRGQEDPVDPANNSQIIRPDRPGSTTTIPPRGR